jgi:ERCC4-type nuclease
MEIIIDDREKAIFPFLEDMSNKYNIEYKIQRSEIGDYAICYHGHILLVIERKTWEDLSASMRDGRKDNVKKLLNLRTKIDCKLTYLIEGDATPKIDKKFGRLPFKNLQAHLDHLMMRDNIHVIYSKNLEYTAERLFMLAINCSTMKEELKRIDGISKLEKVCVDVDSKVDTSTDTLGGNSKLLKEKQQSTINITEQILRCLPGIGSILAPILAEKGYNLHKLYNCKKDVGSAVEESDVDSDVEDSEDNESKEVNTKSNFINVNHIASLKYTTGKSIGLEKANKIILGIKRTFNSSSEVSHKTRVRILSTIPLISKDTAEKILEEVNLLDIIDGNTSVDELTKIKKTEKTKLGKKASENILKYMK